MVNIQDLTITSLETINAFDVVTGAYKFTLDELQNASIANSQETSDITGKGGRKLATLKRNKAVTISGTNGLVSGGLLETQTGSEFATTATTVMWSECVTVTSGAAKTSYKAVGTTGAEIEAIYVRNANGTLGAALVQAEAAGGGKFAYDPESNTISLDSGITEGTELVVYYKRNIMADVLDNTSDHYSGKCALYIDALAEDKCANVYRVQFYIPKADFSGEFSFEMGTDQTTHGFEAQALAGACGAGGQLWTYTVFGADAEDVA